MWAVQNHIASAVGKIYGMLRNLWAVKCSTPLLQLLATTYLIPVHLYGCEIYANCDANDLRKLKVSYNNIVRYVFNRGVRDSISVFSYQICNMCFENLLKFKCLIFLPKNNLYCTTNLIVWDNKFRQIGERIGIDSTKI